MRSGILAGTAVAILFAFALNSTSAFCFNPIMACDPTRATGIGAVSLTDGNGNPVHITSVLHKAATSTTPAYCEIRGYRRPLDPFIIALPDSWRGRYWQTGNGGAAGTLGSITPGISREYVSASGSGGHDMSQEAGLADFQVFYPPDDPVARYLGTGDIDQASNFACVEIAGANVAIRPGQLSIKDQSSSTFTAFIELPRHGDWQASSAVCEGAPAILLTRQGRRYKATFNKGDLKNIASGDKAAFTVTLFLKQQGNRKGSRDAAPIAFEGSDTVQIAER